MMNFYLYCNGLDKEDVYKQPIIDYVKDWVHVNERFPVIEHIIKKDPHRAQYYTMNIFLGRWPEAEPYIMKDPFLAYRYARKVIKGRWLEAESYIMKNVYWWSIYKREFEI